MSEPSAEAGAIWERLRTILDPEFGVNIVDLGLIYSVEVAGRQANVTMTLTTPNCPAGSWIVEGVRRAVANSPDVAKSQVNLVFDPRWNAEMLSDAARRQLGLAPPK